MRPTADQIERFRHDGFVVLEAFMPEDEMERVRDRFARCFEHDWETGIAPDEVN